MQELRGLLSLRLQRFDGDTLWRKDWVLSLGANRSNLLVELPLAQLPTDFDPRTAVLVLNFRSEDERHQSRNLYYFRKPRELVLTDPGLVIRRTEELGRTYLEVQAERLAKDLYLNNPEGDLFLSDNYFDLLPGETVRLEVRAGDPDPDRLLCHHLGML